MSFLSGADPVYDKILVKAYNRRATDYSLSDVKGLSGTTSINLKRIHMAKSPPWIFNLYCLCLFQSV